MTRRSLVGLLFAALTLAPLVADAAPPPPPRHPPGHLAQAGAKDKVSVRLMVVHATMNHKRVDPRLQKLTRYLSHLRYTGYDLLQIQSVDLGPKGKESFSIEGGARVEIQMLSKDEKRCRLRVQMTRGGSKLLDTTLSVNRNGTFIVAGPKHKGGILVLPLTARY